jgi:protein SCO1/2
MTARLLLLGAVGTTLLAGCGGGAPTPRSEAPPAPDRPTEYPLTGVVRDVNRESGIVTIRHEEIPGYMPAMTMPFTVADAAQLAELAPGDRVRGTLKVRDDDHVLSGLEVTEQAESPTLRLDLGGAAPALRTEQPVLKPGQPVPDFAVTTQDGKPLRLSDLRGKVVVMTFIYTRCPLPNFCPLMDKKFAALAGMIQPIPDRAKSVRLLSISFDPEHDTPEVLTAYARLRGAREPLWTFAVASHEELRKVAEPLGLKYGPTANEIIHSLSTAVIAPDGTLARLEAGNTWTPEGIHKTVVGLLPGFSASGGPSRTE